MQVEGDKKAIAKFHVDRVAKLRDVIKAISNPVERLNYEKQVVDGLAASVQTGFFPAGLAALDQLAKGKGKLNSYAAFRKISADYSLKNDEPGANMMANQKAWLAELKGFLEAYPQADELLEALIQLANVNEFNAEEEEARKYYNQLVKDHAATEPGKKAAGALRRLDLVGKTIALKGPGLNGEDVDVAKLRGKTLLVVFWATWADPVKRDLPELVKVYNTYRSKDFEIVGVNLDNDRADVDAFLKGNSLPWPQIFEAGGIEKNRYATEYGIIAVPTMILVDGQGKVLNRNLRSAAELDRQLSKTIDGKQAGAGVALDR